MFRQNKIQAWFVTEQEVLLTGSGLDRLNLANNINTLLLYKALTKHV